MDIKIQKKLRFIPIVNFLISSFSWIKWYMHFPDPKSFLKIFFQLFLSMVILSLPTAICSNFIESQTLNDVLFLIQIYVTLYIISYIFIQDQEKHQNNE